MQCPRRFVVPTTAWLRPVVPKIAGKIALGNGPYRAVGVLLTQQARRLGEVCRHAAGLVAGQPVGGGAALRFIVELILL